MVRAAVGDEGAGGRGGNLELVFPVAGESEVCFEGGAKGEQRLMLLIKGGALDLLGFKILAELLVLATEFLLAANFAFELLRLL